MTKFTYYRNLSLSVICIALGLAIGFVNLNQVNNGFPFKSHLVEKVVLLIGFKHTIMEYASGLLMIQ